MANHVLGTKMTWFKYTVFNNPKESPKSMSNLIHFKAMLLLVPLPPQYTELQNMLSKIQWSTYTAILSGEIYGIFGPF